MDSIFKALNDSTRREIINMLKKKDMNAGDIADKFEMTKPSISHHLDILKRANLINGVKKGQFIVYTINTTVIDDLFRWIYNLKLKDDKEKITKGNSFLGLDPDSNFLHSK